MTRIVGTLENDLGRLYNKNVDIPLVERGREPPKGGFAFEGRLALPREVSGMGPGCTEPLSWQR